MEIKKLKKNHFVYFDYSFVTIGSLDSRHGAGRCADPVGGGFHYSPGSPIGQVRWELEHMQLGFAFIICSIRYVTNHWSTKDHGCHIIIESDPSFPGIASRFCTIRRSATVPESEFRHPTFRLFYLRWPSCACAVRPHEIASPTKTHPFSLQQQWKM